MRQARLSHVMLLLLGCVAACAAQPAPAPAAPIATTADPTAVEHGSPAAVSGTLCGTRGAGSCTAEEFCNFEPDKDCGGTDRGGHCMAKPNMCTKDYRPVCGCDHVSYANGCGAHSAGISILHDGACTEVDCQAVGGHAVTGIGPAPECAKGEVSHSWITPDNGSIAIEGMLCCIPAS